MRDSRRTRAILVVLVLFWLVVARRLWLRPSDVHGAWSLAALVAWVAPFALAAPAFSRDIYSYVAQGELVDRLGRAACVDAHAHNRELFARFMLV